MTGFTAVLASWFIDVTIKIGGTGMLLSDAIMATFFYLIALLVASSTKASRRYGFTH